MSEHLQIDFTQHLWCLTFCQLFKFGDYTGRIMFLTLVILTRQGTLRHNLPSRHVYDIGKYVNQWPNDPTHRQNLNLKTMQCCFLKVQILSRVVCIFSELLKQTEFCVNLGLHLINILVRYSESDFRIQQMNWWWYHTINIIKIHFEFEYQRPFNMQTKTLCI